MSDLRSRLYAIVDAGVAGRAGWAAPDLARAYLRGGARYIQVRAKSEASGAVLRMCEEVVADCRRFGATVIVNDRADLARLAAADGVHVGQTDLAPAQIRSIVGPGAIVGLSTHSVEQLEAAVAEPVSYVAVGPIFDTPTKPGGRPRVGLDLVRHAAGLGHPVVAIGGITLATAPLALAAGAIAVAVIADLCAGGDPEGRVREYIEQLDSPGPTHSSKGPGGVRV